MQDRVRSLQQSISTIIKALKVMEPSVQTAHGELKLVPADLQAMKFIAANPGSMSSALAHDLSVAPTTATSIVDRLVDRGFVSRARLEENRRVVALDLTPEGREALGRLIDEELVRSARMLELMSEEEQRVFVEVMARVASAALEERR